MRLRLFLFILSMSVVVASAEEAQPLHFVAWKEQQVLDAQNQVLRQTARLNQVKTKLSSDVQATQVSAAERDLKRAQDSLAAASELAVDDYVAVYLPTLTNQPQSLQKLTEKLSKDELAELFKKLVQKSEASDAKRNSARLEALSEIGRSR